MTEKEIEIRELENKLAELKNGIRKQKALEHIKKTADNKKKEIEKTIENLKYQYSELYCELSSLEPRIADLLDIARTLYDNKMFKKINVDGLYFTNHYAYDGCYDGIRVTLSDMYAWVYMGHYRTEYNGNDMYIITHYSQNMADKNYNMDVESNVSYVILGLRSSISAMKYFIEHFDKFEESVYDYANNL